MNGKPNVFVGLDEVTVVVGLHGLSSLQVWNLAEGKLEREFEGKGRWCYSMVILSGGRIAAGWECDSQCVVTVFDVSKGQKLQDLTGFGSSIHGLAFVDGHLLAMCDDKTLRVWTESSEGKVG